MAGAVLSVVRDDLFWVRLPLLDVREQEPPARGLFRLFDLYLLRAQAVALIRLAKDLEAALGAAQEEDDGGGSAPRP